MDVKELLDSKHIDYISRGRDYSVRCMNPEHEDSNPSMNIDKISGIFHCYSCGYAGDIYEYFSINKEKFINIKIQKVREKIATLLSNKHIPIPLDAVSISEDFRDISKSTLRKFGAFTTESIKGMDGRIVFPISTITGNIIGFQGRYMYSDLEPKYKFHPEHVTLPLYPSVVKPINNSIILVEGIFDMINLHDKGLHNAVCTFGTAFGSVHKKPKKARNIEKLLQFKYQGIEKIWVMYDGDKSGRDATANLLDYAKESFTIDSVDLTDGMDPGGMDKQQVNELKRMLYD
jgi:DNA primase